MRKQEAMMFGAFEVSSYVCLGLAWYNHSYCFAAVGAVLLSVTLVWFFRLAKRLNRFGMGNQEVRQEGQE